MAGFLKTHQILPLSRALVTCSLICASSPLPGAELPVIFPLPQAMEITDGRFVVDDQTQLLVPQSASAGDLKLARFLVREMSDKYGIALKIRHAAAIPNTGNVTCLESI